MTSKHQALVLNLALDKKIQAMSEARKGVILSPELICITACIFNVYGLKLVKHRVFFFIYY